MAPPPRTTLSKETVTLIFWNLPPQTECAVSVVYSFQIIFTQTSQKCYKRTAIIVLSACNLLVVCSGSILYIRFDFLSLYFTAALRYESKLMHVHNKRKTYCLGPDITSYYNNCWRT